VEFYQANWEILKASLVELFNHMFLTNTITTQQTKGIIVCIKKKGEDKDPEGYHPITLLNNEYKILARILAEWLQCVVQEQVTRNQYCGGTDKTIIDAVANIQDTIAQAETLAFPMCLVSLDFQQAFDRVSHQYLFAVLRRYGVSEWFLARIHELYDKATATVQINGALYGSIRIQRGIQGCPLRLKLFTLSLQPFLRAMDRAINRIP
jgi:hypothetical protein